MKDWNYDNTAWKITSPWWYRALRALAIFAGSVALAAIVWLITIMMFVI